MCNKFIYVDPGGGGGGGGGGGSSDVDQCFSQLLFVLMMEITFIN